MTPQEKALLERGEKVLKQTFGEDALAVAFYLAQLSNPGNGPLYVMQQGSSSLGSGNKKEPIALKT